ncbi:hypothetical protein D3C72_1453350 [compost metagenome]
MLLFFQSLQLFDLRQVEQALDQLLHARTFALDVVGKALALCLRHRSLEQLRCAANGRQRALQLMGQGMNVALDIVLAFQLGAHALHRRRQLPQLTAAIVRQRGALSFADSLGVMGQAS